MTRGPSLARDPKPVRVYKVGGPALEDPGLVGPLADDIRRAPGPSVLVHGGGRHVDRMLRALAIESRFVGGRRATSPAAMEVVEMVLSGVVNKDLAAGLTNAGLPSVGILDSKDFAGLHPGYFAVFSGVYSSNADASQHLTEAKAAGFSAAYARQVTR